jgi:hypothetical protein
MQMYKNLHQPKISCCTVLDVYNIASRKYDVRVHMHEILASSPSLHFGGKPLACIGRPSPIQSEHCVHVHVHVCVHVSVLNRGYKVTYSDILSFYCGVN